MALRIKVLIKETEILGLICDGEIHSDFVWLVLGLLLDLGDGLSVHYHFEGVPSVLLLRMPPRKIKLRLPAYKPLPEFSIRVDLVFVILVKL